MIGNIVLGTQMEKMLIKGKEKEKQKRQIRQRLVRMSTDLSQVYQSME
jgi:hypothetical protein